MNPVLDDEIALRAEHLTKRYGSVQALDQLNLTVPRGGVHAFLGPNGSGKTTTIRVATGLTRADGGTLRVFGRDVRHRLSEVAGLVGAIVEAPKFFPAFSGRHNLRLLAMPLRLPITAVDAALDQVGLSERGRTPVAGYSLGMKQRLAIAAAMLKQPRLLIFDEPTNGLDPAGIQQIRTTMRDLADRGITVLMSSHVLGEVEQVAHTASIIARGRLLAEGPLHELVRPTQRCVVIEVPDASAVTALLQPRYAVTVTAPQVIEVRGLPDDPPPDPGELNRFLAHHGWFVSALATRHETLEDAFLRLTSGPQSPPACLGTPFNQPEGSR